MVLFTAVTSYGQRGNSPPESEQKLSTDLLALGFCQIFAFTCLNLNVFVSNDCFNNFALIWKLEFYMDYWALALQSWNPGYDIGWDLRH